MTAYVTPARKWAGEAEAEAPRPTVLVSSRDGVKPPRVPGALRLAKVLDATGWAGGATYALAEVPDTSRKAAHRLASVGVRFSRGGQRGWACWYQVDDGGWRFSCAYLGMQRMGLRELTATLLGVTP